MSIVNHTIDQNGDIYFEIRSAGQDFTDTLTRNQVLALQSQSYEKTAHLPLYHYFYGKPSLKQPAGQPIPHKLHTMIVDYVDVGHLHAALEIIETCLSSGYSPTTKVVLILMDILLQRTKIKNKQHRKDRTEQYFKAQTLLLHILEQFGADSLAPIWTKFGGHHDNGKRKGLRSQTNYMDISYMDSSIEEEEEEDNEDDDGNIQHGSRLSRFNDFWQLALYCFSPPIDRLSLNRLGGRLALKVLIQLLNMDIQSRRDRMDELSECLLLQSIPVNAYGERTHLDHQLSIIFTGISYTPTNHFYDLYAGNMDHAMELLNMLILLSYCDYNLLTTAYLVDQTYRRILTLELDPLRHVLQTIQIPIFITYLCDLYFEDADTRHVLPEHQHYKHRHKHFSAKKMVHYIMKTGPHSSVTMDWHCTMVMWRWLAHLRVFSYRYDLTTKVVVADYTNELALSHWTDWRKHIRNIMAPRIPPPLLDSIVETMSLL